MLTPELSNFKTATAIADEMKAYEAVYSITGTLATPVTGLLMRRREWKVAIQMNERALEITRETKNGRALQFFGHNLGAILVARGQTLNAEAPLNESLRSAERNEDRYHAALTLIELANVALQKGDAANAHTLYEKSLRLASIHGNDTAMGVSLHQLGLLALEAGDFKSARTMFVESLRIKQNQPESVSLAKTLIQIGALAEIQGNDEDAVLAYDFALQILKRLKSTSAAEAQDLLDSIAHKTKKPEVQ